MKEFASRLAWLVAVSLVLGILVLGITAASDPVSAQEDPECTIVGTEGPDVLDGGSGIDVICGLGGDDVISGGSGADIIYGGGGNDTIKAGSGADTVYAGDGDDVVDGGSGADVITGGSGIDVLSGGSGSDDITGDQGADELFGGSGGDDLRGGPGVDSADGGSGSDICAAETIISCETELPDESGDTTTPEVQLLSPGDGAAVGQAATVEVQATDDVGVTQVELLVDGSLAGSRTSPDGDGIYRFEVTFETSGRYELSSRATDAAGNVGDSSVVTVTLPAEALPSTYFVFSDPQTMVDVFAVLESEGLHPVEFEHVVTQPGGELTGGGFYAPDVPRADQEAYYRTLQQDKYGADPAIISVRISGSFDVSSLGDLADQVDEVEQVPALSGDGEAIPEQQTGASVPFAAGEGSAQAAAAREDWWPDTGTVFAFDSSITFALLPPCIFLCPPIFLTQPMRSIVHEFEWQDQEAIDLWGSGFAYEHDFKLINESLNPSTVRPFCGRTSDDFWASRIMLWWDSTIPFFARPYLDTGVLDDCTVSDFTIGVLLPVLMNAGFYTTEIRTLPGDLDESPYQLEAQRMGKAGGALCPFKWCVNAPGSAEPSRQELVPWRREDGTERTVPVFCTGWSVFDLAKADPVIDEDACGS